MFQLLQQWMLDRGQLFDLARGGDGPTAYVGRKTAGGTIPARGLIQYNGSAYVAGSANAEKVIGVNRYNAAVSSGAVVHALRGHVDALAGTAIQDGALLKAYPAGKLGPAVTHAMASVQVNDEDDYAGAAFTNQPAGDDVEVVSSSAADTTQNITIIGHLSGALVVETKTLTGQTQVVFSNGGSHYTDVLAVILDAACAGTITVREASANQAICTISPGDFGAGVVEATPGEDDGYCATVQVAASGASTAYVVLAVQNATGEDRYLIAQMNGTTKVAISAAYSTVDGSVDSAANAAEIYKITAAGVGALAADRKLCIYTKSSADAVGRVCGRALESASDGDVFRAVLC